MYFYKHRGYLYLEVFNTEIGTHLEYLPSDITLSVAKMAYYKLVKSTEAKAFEGSYIRVVDRGINGKGPPNPNTLPFFSSLPNMQTPGHENTGDCRRANKK